MSGQDSKLKEKLVGGYQAMLEHAREFLDKARDQTGPKVKQAIDYAGDKVMDVGDLTKEEADKLGQYLTRDLHDAATYIAEGERELADWLRLDLLYIEDRALEAFSNMVDHTALELQHLREDAARFGEWHTGEITSMGTLKCRQCGQHVHFNSTGHIPPCPKCHGTVFVRDTD